MQRYNLRPWGWEGPAAWDRLGSIVLGSLPQCADKQDPEKLCLKAWDNKSTMPPFYRNRHINCNPHIIWALYPWEIWLNLTHPSAIACDWLEPSPDFRASLSSVPLWPHRLAPVDPETQNPASSAVSLVNSIHIKCFVIFVWRVLKILFVREAVPHTPHRDHLLNFCTAFPPLFPLPSRTSKTLPTWFGPHSWVYPVSSVPLRY